jgi:hypothetical protein
MEPLLGKGQVRIPAKRVSRVLLMRRGYAAPYVDSAASAFRSTGAMSRIRRADNHLRSRK